MGAERPDDATSDGKGDSGMSIHESAGRARASKVTCAIAAEQVAARVRELAARISADYQNQPLLVIGVLKGAWVFMADLVRQLTLPVSCEFVRLSSYGLGMTTSGEPRMLLDLQEPIAGRAVLVVDDIVDTGISMKRLLEYFQRQQPASLRLCALLDKPSRRRVALQVDYVGFEIPDQFVVGYGIDYAEQFRELPYIGYVTQHE
jgi:hypoxanthine phosphoribosyltransferase